MLPDLQYVFRAIRDALSYGDCLADFPFTKSLMARLFFSTRWLRWLVRSACDNRRSDMRYKTGTHPARERVENTLPPFSETAPAYSAGSCDGLGKNFGWTGRISVFSTYSFLNRKGGGHGKCYPCSSVRFYARWKEVTTASGRILPAVSAPHPCRTGGAGGTIRPMNGCLSGETSDVLGDKHPHGLPCGAVYSAIQGG